MFKRTKYTAEEKYEILKAYDNGSDTMKEILIKYNSSADTFYKWKYNYSKYGIDRLRKPETYKKYSKELKQLFKNIDMALKASSGANPMIHSDRGYQYTSNKFKDKLDAAEMTQSMSRVGKCIDNGPMEGFWESSNAKNTTYTNIIHMMVSLMKLMNISISTILSDYKKD